MIWVIGPLGRRTTRHTSAKQTLLRNLPSGHANLGPLRNTSNVQDRWVDILASMLTNSSFRKSGTGIWTPIYGNPCYWAPKGTSFFGKSPNSFRWCECWDNRSYKPKGQKPATKTLQAPHELTPNPPKPES